MQFPIRQIEFDEFPPLLREIPDLPRSLYIRGVLPSEPQVFLCVVGSRACSPYGKRLVQSLILGLTGYPVTIVSGLAMGIDAEAHKAALDAGLTTVAVLPSSCDDASIYPSINHALAQKILARGGALISEYKAPTKPMRHSFAERNRIMAGISLATLIIEAEEKSGTLITARLALDYNREVLAIPHEIGKVSGAGVNRLIREGATLVRSSEDILTALNIKHEEKSDDASFPTDLHKSELKILELLTEPLVKDEMIERLELNAQEISIMLSSLLIRGLIRERLGKIERV